MIIIACHACHVSYINGFNTMYAQDTFKLDIHIKSSATVYIRWVKGIKEVCKVSGSNNIY